jgi:hypothetical protein
MQFQSAPATGGDLYTWVLASAASAQSAMSWDPCDCSALLPLLCPIIADGLHLVMVNDKLAVDPAPGEPLLRRDPVCPLALYLVDARPHLFHYHSYHSFPPASTGFPADYRTSRSGSIRERRMDQFPNGASKSAFATGPQDVVELSTEHKHPESWQQWRPVGGRQGHY